MELLARHNQTYIYTKHTTQHNKTQYNTTQHSTTISCITAAGEAGEGLRMNWKRFVGPRNEIYIHFGATTSRRYFSGRHAQVDRIWDIFNLGYRTIRFGEKLIYWWQANIFVPEVSESFGMSPVVPQWTISERCSAVESISNLKLIFRFRCGLTFFFFIDWVWFSILLGLIYVSYARFVCRVPCAENRGSRNKWLVLSYWKPNWL